MNIQNHAYPDSFHGARFTADTLVVVKDGEVEYTANGYGIAYANPEDPQHSMNAAINNAIRNALYSLGAQVEYERIEAPVVVNAPASEGTSKKRSLAEHSHFPFQRESE
ncbi:MAG: hypothetical protein ACYC1C_02175 [Chloroflexota bacterium]